MTYAVAMLAFTFAGFVVLYALQRLQAVLPFNPTIPRRGLARSRIQHFRVPLHYQYQL